MQGSGVGVAKAASVMGCERVERVVEHHVVHSAARNEALVYLGNPG